MRFFWLLSTTIVLLLSSVFIITAQQQSRNDLEKRRASILKDIQATQMLLEETKKDKNATIGQLNALNAKLKARERLISNISQEMGHINVSIHLADQQIALLNKQLSHLKIRYAQSVRYAYKNQKSQNMLAFLLSADDFNDAFRRLQYMKKSRDFRQAQASKLQGTHQELQKQIGILGDEKQNKQQLLTVEESQKSQLNEESEQTNLIVKELKSKESNLSSDISKKKSDAKRLDNAIKAEIQKEVELARKRAMEEAKRKADEEARIKAIELAKKQEEARRVEEIRQREIAANNARPTTGPASGKPSDPAKVKASEDSRVKVDNSEDLVVKSESKATPAAKPVTTNNEVAANKPVVPNAAPVATHRSNVEKPSYKLSLTPEVQALSNNFAANRGKLPWPVEVGYIALPFGKYQHPLEPKVTMENAGIDIAAKENSVVRAVFEGTVNRVVSIAGSYMIIVNHGEFFSVYTNLKSVSIKQGDKVGLKQQIGIVGRNDDGEHLLHFEICKINANNSISNVNPAEWIAR